MQRQPSGEHLVQGSHVINVGVATEGSHSTYPLKVKVKSLSCVHLFATPWTVAHQAPPSIGFSRQEYWSGLPFSSLGIFLTQESNPSLLQCSQILYQLSYKGSPLKNMLLMHIIINDSYLNKQEGG